MKRILIFLLCLSALAAASGCATRQTVADSYVDGPHPAHMGRPNWL
ncbi:MULTISPECIES: hypothetical protein [Burkholderia]|nr:MULTISPECIES: hypothetical protein [Burkholderia]